VIYKHGAELHPYLQDVINEIESDGYYVLVNDTARTFEEHVNLYKEKYPDNWYEIIPLNSMHLPTWQSEFCLAVDINVWKGDKKLTGDEIKELVQKESTKAFSFGIGKTFLHIDYGRNHVVEWRYS
jgi:hypothetical protein